MRSSSPAFIVVALVALVAALAGTGYAAVARPAGPPDVRQPAPSPSVQAMLTTGRTLRGVYFVGSSSAAGNQLATGQISFALPLARAPIAHFVRADAVRPTACPGTAPRPLAARGHLCVYEARESGATEHRVLDPVSGRVGVARVWGAGLSVRSIRGGDVFSSGTWAVTAR
jgi:hypothetical protein